MLRETLHTLLESLLALNPAVAVSDYMPGIFSVAGLTKRICNALSRLVRAAQGRQPSGARLRVGLFGSVLQLLLLPQGRAVATMLAGWRIG